MSATGAEATMTPRERAIYKLALIAAVNGLILRQPDEAIDARRVLEVMGASR